MTGKSIRIFLPDNNVTGLRFAELVNWTGQAIACPRQRLSQLKDWPESQKPGVYFLFEKPFEHGQSQVYIGESENVFKRLADHERKKDFWHEVVIFTSKDENLTKAHVKYLEHRLLQEATKAGRYILENNNSPIASELPRADRAAMFEFMANLRMVLGTLGFVLLEPLLAKEREIQGDASQLPPAFQNLQFQVRELTAFGALTDSGFILKKHSMVSKQVSESMPARVWEQQRELVEQGILVDSGDYFELLENTVFSSSSSAAAFIAGTSRSGPQSWKTAEGQSLKMLEDELLR